MTALRFPHKPHLYANSRPTYPLALFDFIADLISERQRLWDCAAGSGQSIHELSQRFQSVVASDADFHQINLVRDNRQIALLVCKAEHAALQTESVNLAIAAQALHWFNQEKFWSELERVLRPGDYFASWCYGITRMSVDRSIDQILASTYDAKLRSMMPQVWTNLLTGHFKFPSWLSTITPPKFEMTALWDIESLHTYLNSLASVSLYRNRTRIDPVPDLMAEIRQVWPREHKVLPVVWEIMLYIGYKLS